MSRTTISKKAGKVNCAVNSVPLRSVAADVNPQPGPGECAACVYWGLCEELFSNRQTSGRSVEWVRRKSAKHCGPPRPPGPQVPAAQSSSYGGIHQQGGEFGGQG
jgi:hypothetical protein